MLRTINALSVRTSLRDALTGRIPLESDSRSMRRNGLPDRQNVRRCIRVAVVDRAAFWARPFPHAQRQFLNDMPAVGASLRGREPAVNFDHGLAVPLGLFFDHADGHSDGCVVQRAGQAVVFDHAAQVEVFDADHIETGYEIGTQLVQRVAAAVGDLLVDASNMALDLHAPLAALRSPGEALLVEGQASLPLRAVLRVTYALAVAKGGEAGDAEVDADILAGLLQWRWLCFHNQRDEILAARRADQTNRGRMRDRFARPLDLDGSDLGELEHAPLGVEREAALGVVSRLPHLFALEGRVGGALVEEVRERHLQVAQGLLKTHARYLVQPHRFRLLFEQRQRLVGRRVSHALTRAKGVCSRPQCPVPDVTHATERPRKMLLLLRRRVAAKFPSGFHVSHYRS